LTPHRPRHVTFPGLVERDHQTLTCGWPATSHHACSSRDHGFAEWTYDVRLADGSDGCERGIDVLEFANGRLARKDAFRKVRG